MFAMRHPDNLCCPICGCEAIVYWPEIFDKTTWPEKTREYEVCAACNYGAEDFPYEDFGEEY